MQLYFTNASTTIKPQSLNPKGCRVTQLGSPPPSGSFITTGQLREIKAGLHKKQSTQKEPHL
jgi:hypothetical protein